MMQIEAFNLRCRVGEQKEATRHPEPTATGWASEPDRGGRMLADHCQPFGRH